MITFAWSCLTGLQQLILDYGELVPQYEENGLGGLNIQFAHRRESMKRVYPWLHGREAVLMDLILIFMSNAMENSLFFYEQTA